MTRIYYFFTIYLERLNLLDNQEKKKYLCQTIMVEFQNYL
jgi:hypothetical protein